MSKAKQVRNMIAQAKAKGLDGTALIGAVMAEFGFARQLARAYINNNWNKVEAAPIEAPIVEDVKPAKALSMSKDAIRKREKRAAAKAAKEAAAV